MTSHLASGRPNCSPGHTAPGARKSNVEGLNLTGRIAGNGIDANGRMRVIVGGCAHGLLPVGM